MMRPLQVEPPSKLTAANMPAAGTTTLVTMTILFGLVGLTAIASSDSLLESWLTSTFFGVAGGAANAGVVMNASATKEANNTLIDFTEPPISTERLGQRAPGGGNNLGLRMLRVDGVSVKPDGEPVAGLIRIR